MVNCIIVDDEPLARQILESYLLKTDELHLIKCCENATDAFEVMQADTIELIFLDIKMPGMSGIDFIKILKSPPAVIFTTAYPDYAVSSYELEAVDYLLKPVTYDRFCKSVSKFLKLYSTPEPGLSYSYFKIDGKLVKLHHEDIVYAESVKDYLMIQTLQKKYITHMTMKYLVTLLPGTMFRRVHRSFLIGTKHITSIGRNEIELGAIKIPVGESFRGK